jgi:Zn-dependent peptidase ImmA (M78 family)
MLKFLKFIFAPIFKYRARRSLKREQSFEHLDYRKQLTSDSKNPAEIFANQFAANLIMPKKQVRQEFKKVKALSINSQILSLAKTFGVSCDIMCQRLKELKLI